MAHRDLMVQRVKFGVSSFGEIADSERAGPGEEASLHVGGARVGVLLKLQPTLPKPYTQGLMSLGFVKNPILQAGKTAKVCQSLQNKPG